MHECESKYTLYGLCLKNEDEVSGNNSKLFDDP